MPAPRESRLVLKGSVEGDGLDWRADVTGAVDRVRIAEANLHPAEVGGPLEQGALGLRRGDARAGASEPGRSQALFPMMMGQEHPLDPAHPDVGEPVQHAAVAQIDQQRRVTIAEDVDVAGVGPDKQIRREGRVDGPPRGRDPGWSGGVCYLRRS